MSSYVAQEVSTAYNPPCRDCGADALVEDQQEGCIVCTECGTKIRGQLIMDSQEWRNLKNDDGTNKEDPNRVGSFGKYDNLLGGTDLSTTFDSSSTLTRMQQDPNRQIKQALDRLHELSGRLQLSTNIIDKGCQLYKKAYDCPEMKTRKTDALIVACLFQACRLAHVPRQFKELCPTVGIEVKHAARQFQKMKNNRLFPKSTKKMRGSEKKTSVSAEQVKRYANMLGFTPRIVDVIAEVQLKATDLAGSKQPSTVAAAVIYLVSSLQPRTQNSKSFADICKKCAAAEKPTKQFFQSTIWSQRETLMPADKFRMFEYEDQSLFVNSVRNLSKSAE